MYKDSMDIIVCVWIYHQMDISRGTLGRWDKYVEYITPRGN